LFTFGAFLEEKKLEILSRNPTVLSLDYDCTSETLKLFYIDAAFWLPTERKEFTDSFFSSYCSYTMMGESCFFSSSGACFFSSSSPVAAWLVLSISSAVSVIGAYSEAKVAV
jgi:hypothetical protein